MRLFFKYTSLSLLFLIYHSHLKAFCETGDKNFPHQAHFVWSGDKPLPISHRGNISKFCEKVKKLHDNDNKFEVIIWSDTGELIKGVVPTCNDPKIAFKQMNIDNLVILNTKENRKLKEAALKLKEKKF